MKYLLLPISIFALTAYGQNSSIDFNELMEIKGTYYVEYRQHSMRRTKFTQIEIIICCFFDIKTGENR